MSHRTLLSTLLLGSSLLLVPACDDDGGRDGGAFGPVVDDQEDKSDNAMGSGGSGGTWSMSPRVKVYAFDPVLNSGERLSASQGWYNPHDMTYVYRDAVRDATWGSVSYQVDQFAYVEGFPLRTDGDRYDELSYLRCINEGDCKTDSPYETDLAYYAEVLDWCEDARNGVEEIWVFGAPWFGMPESQMMGDGAYWLNSTPLGAECDTPMVIMAFSYHVPAANMLHNLGHRIESHLNYAFGRWDSGRYGPSPWEQFSGRTENGTEPECGNVHWPPNTLTEYGYSDSTEVESGCDRWLDYPNHADVEPEPVSCFTWGCSGDTQFNYLTWWIQHLPHNEGQADGYQTNWQRYIFDYRSHM